MELQELSVKGLATAVRYELAPRFADSRGALVEWLTELLETKEFGWGEQVVTAQHEERKIAAFAGESRAPNHFRSRFELRRG